MDGGALHGRRPRPVADAPAVDASALAKAWLLTLVADAPLQQVAAVPAADLARSGPALCGAVLAALRSDADLERLLASGPEGGAPPATAAGRLTGARTPAAITAGVEALRAAASRALRAELREPVPELVADLGDRLAYVCARVAEAALADRPTPAETQRRTGPLAGALAASRTGEPAANGAAPAAATPQPAVAPGPDADAAAAPVVFPAPEPRAPGAPQTPAASTPPAPAASPAPTPVAPPASPATAPPAASAPPAPGAPPTPVAPPAQEPPAATAPPTPVAWPTGPAPASSPTPTPPLGAEIIELPGVPGDLDPLTSLAEELAAAPPDGVEGAPPPLAVPDGSAGATVTRVRQVDTSWDDAAQSGPPWLASIERRLERRREDGLPFAVLLAEIDDLDRLMASQTGREVGLALETAERGLTAELAPADLVVRERLGRWWLLSPDRDAVAARDLGERVASAISTAVLAGAPLSVSIGVAVCPDDGEGVDDLAGRADEGMFAARAAGIPLA